MTLWFALAILNTPDAKLDFMKSNPCVQQWVKDGYLGIAIGDYLQLLKSDNWDSGATALDEADLKTIRGNND